MNNPHWESSENFTIFAQLLYSYFIYTGKLFLDVFFLLLFVILSELREKPKSKNWVTEKSTQKDLCEGYHFFWLHVLFSMSFCRFLCALPPPSKVTYLQNDPYKDIHFVISGIMCDDIMNKRSKRWKSPTI